MTPASNHVRLLAGVLLQMKIKSAKPIAIQRPGYLQQRYGDHHAGISTATTLKLKSSIKDVARVRYGTVPPEIHELTKKLQVAPQGVSDSDFIFGYKGADGWVTGSIETDPVLQHFVETYPDLWGDVQALLGLRRGTGRHASAYVVANDPVADWIPTMEVGGATVTQFTMGDVEAVGGVKFDILGLNSLADIEVAIKLVQELEGWDPKNISLNGESVLSHEVVPFRGQLYSIWKLPEEQAVFTDICKGKTETVFQFNTKAAIQWLGQFDHSRPDGRMAISSIVDMSAFTALDRPGPLDYYVTGEDGSMHNMLVEYARRLRGEKPVGEIPILTAMLPETQGVITYQEQMQRIYQTLGGTTPEEAEEFRRNIAKKKVLEVAKGKARFMEGAIPKVGHEVAEEVFRSIDTFSNYGFCQAHAYSYSVIAYACAFLKHFYPLAWWTAVLRNADKDEIATEFWPYVGHLILMPDVVKSTDTFEIEGDKIRAPLWLLHGIGPTAQAELTAGRPYTDLRSFCESIYEQKKSKGSTKTKNKVVKTKTAIGKEETQDKNGKKRKKTIYDVHEEVVQVEEFKLGHSALTSATIATLVFGGAIDTLFPPETAPLDALEAFNAMMAEVQGDKKPKKVDEKYVDVNVWSQYQMRKAVMPPYSRELLWDFLRIDGAIDRGDRPHHKFGHVEVPMVTMEEFMALNEKTPWPKDHSVDVSLVCYITDARTFVWSDRENLELAVESNGRQYKGVRWGSTKEPRLPPTLKDGALLKGAVAVVHFAKYSEKGFSVKDLEIVQAPLGYNTKEESSN